MPRSYTLELVVKKKIMAAMKEQDKVTQVEATSEKTSWQDLYDLKTEIESRQAQLIELQEDSKALAMVLLNDKTSSRSVVSGKLITITRVSAKEVNVTIQELDVSD